MVAAARALGSNNAPPARTRPAPERPRCGKTPAYARRPVFHHARPTPRRSRTSPTCPRRCHLQFRLGGGVHGREGERQSKEQSRKASTVPRARGRHGAEIVPSPGTSPVPPAAQTAPMCAIMHSGSPKQAQPCCAKCLQGRDYASRITACSANRRQGVDPAARTCVKGSSAAQTTVKGSSMQRKPASGECIKPNLRAKCPQGRELLRELASRGRRFTPLRPLRAAYSTP